MWIRSGRAESVFRLTFGFLSISVVEEQDSVSGTPWQVVNRHDGESVA